MRVFHRALPVLLSSTLLISCAGRQSSEPLPTVPAIDLARYAGTWYEIARLPMWFQRHCVDSKATYTPQSEGRIAVHNECVTDQGTIDTADGMATVVDPGTNAKLAVTFDNWFAKLAGPSREGNYWILDIDPDYRTAMVGTPNRRYLWLLSRTPDIDEATYQRFILIAKQLGFQVSDLIRTRRASHPPGAG